MAKAKVKKGAKRSTKGKAAPKKKTKVAAKARRVAKQAPKKAAPPKPIARKPLRRRIPAARPAPHKSSTLSANIYERDLDKTPANYAQLTPLQFIERTASVYPNKPA